MSNYTSKRCAHCDELKPLTDFHRRRARLDGRQANCKPCNIAIAAKHRRNHMERAAELVREWRRAHPGYHAIHKWMSRTYEKNNVCESCGSEGRTEWANISGHYHRNRTDFQELCRGCHAHRDAERREALLA